MDTVENQEFIDLEEKDMVPTTTNELLIRSASAALSWQREDGSFPAGHAGNYGHNETSVRTTGHWLVILSQAYEITDQPEFADAIKRAVEYLLSDKTRPHGKTFYARDVPGKDNCDGLVGQAAPIKGLVYAARAIDYPQAKAVAEEVFSIHPFDEYLGLWKSVEIDGKNKSFDRTLNHQLIFAEAALELTDHSKEAERNCLRFIECLPKNISTHDDGLTRHYVRPPLQKILSPSQLINYAPLVWNELTIHYHARSEEQHRKEIGYYPVITAALASLKQKWPNHESWETQKIKDILSFIDSKLYAENLLNKCEYGTGFPWLDHTLIKLAFNNPTDDEIGEWVGRTVRNNFDTDTGLLTRNTEDPNFRATGAYRFTEIPNTKIRLRESYEEV